MTFFNQLQSTSCRDMYYFYVKPPVSFSRYARVLHSDDDQVNDYFASEYIARSRSFNESPRFTPQKYLSRRLPRYFHESDDEEDDGYYRRRMIAVNDVEPSLNVVRQGFTLNYFNNFLWVNFSCYMMKYENVNPS